MKQSELVELKRKVEQHEKTIAQLLEMIGQTNRQLLDMKLVNHA